MAVWICRAGLQGEYVRKFLAQERIYLIGSVAIDLTGKTDMEELMEIVARTHPMEPEGSVVTMSVQARAFASKAKIGDWVVVPETTDDGEHLLHVGEIESMYSYDGTKSELKHSHMAIWRHGTWKKEIFDEDIQRTLDAFDAFMYFYKMKQEKRFKEIVKKGKPLAKIARPKNAPKSAAVKEAAPADESEYAGSSSYDDGSSERYGYGSASSDDGAHAGSSSERYGSDAASDGRGYGSETKKSVNKPEPEFGQEPEVVYIEVDEDYDDEYSWRCSCGRRKNVVCCKYNKMYYDVLRTRRRFRP